MSRPPPFARLVLSCEHASRAVPARWAALFEGRQALLDSHRGWDAGALPLARALARAWDAPLVAARATRLLADCNRSEGHPRLHGREARALPAEERRRLVESLHTPHREAVGDEVERALAAGPVLHVSVHSFAERLGGERRSTHIGLLYDPGEDHERRTATLWARELRRRLPDAVVHRNRPYRGTSDGLTRTLRRAFAGRGYAGFELELRRDWAAHADTPRGRARRAAIVDSVGALLATAPR